MTDIKNHDTYIIFMIYFKNMSYRLELFYA